MTIDPGQQVRKSSASIQGWLVPLMFVALVGLPVAYYGLNGELAQWNVARAQLKFDEGDVDAGFALLKDAVKQSPNNSALKLELAEKWIENEQARDALVVLDEVIPAMTDPRPALRAKAEALLHLGEPKEALRTVQEVSDYLLPSDTTGPERLNELAYFRALAGVELDIAEGDINSAIGHLAKLTWAFGGTEMSVEDQALVGSALISRHLKRTDLVLDSLNERMMTLDDLLRSIEQTVTSNTYDLMTKAIPFSKQAEKKLRKNYNELASRKQIMAVMHCARALIHQDMGKFDDCDRDRLRMRQLGYDPAAILERMPDEWELMIATLQHSMYLDTRAMVRMAQGKKTGLALNDFNVAVLAIQILRLTGNSQLRNRLRNERGLLFQADELAHTEAILRQHRAKLLMRRGLQEAAELDYLEMEKLGYSRNAPLF